MRRALAGSLVVAMGGFLGGWAPAALGEDDTAGTNVADADGTHAPDVSVSYVPDWNKAGALNDGQTDGAGGHGSVWGTYGDPAQEHWAQYEWDVPVTISASDVWFWNDEPDPGNVRSPKDWSLEYWDEQEEEFLPIEADYPVPEADGAVAGPAEVSFDEVTTTKLRMDLTAQPNDDSWYAVASTEWQVMGTFNEESPEPEDPSDSVAVEDVHVRTTPGQVPDLPQQVWVLPVDGPLSYANVDWEEVDPTSLQNVGTVPIDGAIADDAGSVRATIHVVESLDSEIADVDPTATITRPGVAPVCPATVTARYEDGSAASTVPAQWQEPDPSAYAEPESFGDIAGTVEGFDENALCTFWVLEPFDISNQPPYVQIDLANSPQATGWYTESPRFTILAQERSAAIDSVDYSTDGGNTWTPYEDVEIPLEVEGDVELTARATDAEGREGAAEEALKVDTLDPTTQIKQTEESDTVVVFTLEADDGEAGSGVSRIVYSMGPSENPDSSENDMWATYDKPFSVTRRDVPMYVHVHAQDVAGNEEDTQTVQIDPSDGESPDPGDPDPGESPDPSEGDQPGEGDATGDGANLAATGAETATLAGAALLLMAAGGVLLARRQR